MMAGIGQSIPMKFELVSKERVVMTMEVGPRVHQPFGILHGGASLVLAESAASVGAGRNCPPGMVAVGQEINANHIRSKRDGVVRAVAEPVHVGRTSQVWTIEIRDEAGKLVCISRCTLAVVPAPSAPAARE
ncbi:MAG TPA: hotdog fold thioesterase [Dehalococcoidia bacterium]|nr:hotdog fold thioesterase [Dehalococcoidia bacterium]